MPYLSDSHLIQAARPFLAVTAHERNRSSFLKKFGTILHLPLLHLKEPSNMLYVYILHPDYNQSCDTCFS